MQKSRRIVILVLLVLGSVFAGWHYLPRLKALALIVRVAKQEGIVARLARLGTSKVHEDAVRPITTRHGPLPTRLYRPEKTARRTTILVPGVHMDGIHEARLVGLATELAASGLQVLTVAPPDLTRYRVTANSTDELEDAIAWATAEPSLAPDGKVGITAFSFSGGLALVAAGRPAVKERVAFAFSFGGHGDLLRVLRYLCLGTTDALPPTAEVRALVFGGEHIHIPKPHDYGGVVALLNLAERVVPSPQAGPLQEAITVFLQASSISRLDQAKADATFAQARQLGEAMPEPSRTLMKYVSDRDVAKLGETLAPMLDKLELPAALSPERSPTPIAPVFLLHGADDSVVPASEMVSMASKFKATTRVRAFASRLITHAEADKGAALSEMWSLSAFWQDLMAR
jgi:hypothetical protein